MTDTPRCTTPVLVRPVPGDSVVHRLWAGTKLLCVVVLGLTLSLVPSWPAIGVGSVVVLGAAWLAHIPRGVVPRLPFWFWLTLLIGALLALPSGGSPSLTVAGSNIGLGALLVYLRLTALGVVLIAASALVGWTTPLGEVAPAVARLGAPLRWLRVPVDEWAVAIALSLRSLPLLLEELRILRAARQLRPRRIRGRRSARAGFAELIDVVTAAMAVSIRRAGELGAAITARGGTGQLSAHPAKPSSRDALALVVVLGACFFAALW